MPKIENAEDVQAFVDATEKELQQIKTEIRDIGDLTVINKGSWRGSDEPDDQLKVQGERLGKFMLGVQRNNFSEANLDTVEVLRTSQDKEDKILSVNVKADLGTPITGDASGTDAQYLVPQVIYTPAIDHWINSTSEIIPELDRVEMTGRLHRLPITETEIELSHVTNEVTSKTEGNPTWSYKDLESETFAVWTGVTDELMEDTFADIGSDLLLQVRQSLLDTVETQALNSATNPFIGVIQSVGVETFAHDNTSIVNAEWGDLLSLKHALDSKRKRAGAVFVTHPEIWQSFCNVQDANGRFYFDPTKVGPKVVWGDKLLVSDNMPDLTDNVAGATMALYGNLKKIAYGIRVPLSVKYFTETAYAVAEDENFFRFRTRFGIINKRPAAFALLNNAV